MRLSFDLRIIQVPRQTLSWDAMEFTLLFEPSSFQIIQNTADELPFAVWCLSVNSSLSGRYQHTPLAGWEKINIA